MMVVFNSCLFGCCWMRLLVMLLFVSSMHHSSFSAGAVPNITTAALQSEKAFISTIEAIKNELKSLQIPLRNLDLSKLKTSLLWNPVTKEPTNDTQKMDSQLKDLVKANVLPLSSIPVNEQPGYEFRIAALCQKIFMRAIGAIIDTKSHLYIEGSHAPYTEYFKFRLKAIDDVNDQLNIFLSKTTFLANPIAETPSADYETYFSLVTSSSYSSTYYAQIFSMLAKLVQFKNWKPKSHEDYFDYHITNTIFMSMTYYPANIPSFDIDAYNNTVNSYRDCWFNAFRKLFNDDLKGRKHLFQNITTSTSEVPKTAEVFFTPSFSDLEWINEQKLVYFYVLKLNLAYVKINFANPPDEKSPIDTILSSQIFSPFGIFNPQYVPFEGKLIMDPTNKTAFLEAYAFVKPLIEENEDHRWKLPSENDFMDNIAGRTSFMYLYSASLNRNLREPLSQKEYLLFIFRSFFATERIFYPSSLLLKNLADANKYLPRGATISIKFFEDYNFKVVPARFRDFWDFHCGCYDVMSGAIARRYMQFVVPADHPDFKTKSQEKLQELNSHLGAISLPTNRRTFAENFWSFTANSFAISAANHSKGRNMHYAFNMLRSFLDVVKNVSRELCCDILDISADSLGVGGDDEWAKLLEQEQIKSLGIFVSSYLYDFMRRFPAYAIASLPSTTKDSRAKYTLPANPTMWNDLMVADTAASDVLSADPDVFNAFHEQFKETTKGTFQVSAYLFDNCVNNFMNYLVQNYSKVLLLENPNDAIPNKNDNATVKTRKTKLRTKKIFQFINSRCEFDTFRTDHNVRFLHPLPSFPGSPEEIIGNTLNEHLSLVDGRYDIDNVLFWMTVDMIFTSLIFTDVDLAKRAQTIKDDPEEYLNDESEKSLAFVFGRLNIFGLDKVIKDNLLASRRMVILMNENNHFLFYVTFMNFGLLNRKKTDSVGPDENYSLKYHLWYTMYRFQSDFYSSDAAQQAFFDKNLNEIRETAKEKLEKYQKSANAYLTNDPDASFVYVPIEHSLVKMRTTSVYRMFNPFRPLENSIAPTPYEFYLVPTPKANFNKNENDL